MVGWVCLEKKKSYHQSLGNHGVSNKQKNTDILGLTFLP